MVCILLVEDNETNRDMLQRRLVRKGYEVLVAVDGIEAVDIAQAMKPDIILMDMNLPRLDGWAATRRIRANESTHAIPVIALTANALLEDRQKAIEAGCDSYETKPVDMVRLLDQIETLVGNQG